MGRFPEGHAALPVTVWPVSLLLDQKTDPKPPAACRRPSGEARDPIQVSAEARGAASPCS